MMDTSIEKNKPEYEVDEKNKVSFAGKGLKIDTHEGASPIVDAIRECSKMTYLNLEGNTLGIDAGGAIGEALNSSSHLKYAILKDMFTSRSKAEIPPALKSITSGIMMSNARLHELDLSDNAFGPIGIEVVAPFLESEACESLQILRLNNNGLGPEGAERLAKALESLKNVEIFVCGRNRLENKGAKAVAKSLSSMKKLRHIEMPQNGIRFEGIKALTEAVGENLQVLNLSDNIMTEDGGRVMAEALIRAKKLKMLNFSDCLLKSQGFLHILKSLRKSGSLKNIAVMDFQGNEITGDDTVDFIVETYQDRSNSNHQPTLELSCNEFGTENRNHLLSELEDLLNIQINDDEGDDGQDEDDDEDDSQDENHARRIVENPEQIIKQYLELPLQDLCRDFVHLSSEQFDSNAHSLHEITLKDVGYLLKAIVQLDPSGLKAFQHLLAHMALIKSEEGYHKHPIDLRGPYMALTHHADVLPLSYRKLFAFFLKSDIIRPNFQAEGQKHLFLKAINAI